MARLPSERYLIQQAGGIVKLFEDFTERRITRFVPADGYSVAEALEEIRGSELGDEDKAFAWFWSGYFHAHASRDPELPREAFITEDEETGIVTVTAKGAEIVTFPAGDANLAARAQKAIYDSALTEDEKIRAHFCSGFFYGHADKAN